MIPESEAFLRMICASINPFMLPSPSKTSYDGLGRISQKTWNTGTPYTTVYSYQQGAGGASTTSNQIASVTEGGVSTSYEYDGNENITKIASGTSSITYAYDELNQLIREDNSGTQQTIGYVYDAGGNLLEKRIYGYLPEKTIAELSETEPTDTIAYTYDTAYKDKLVSYDGSAITYDEIGNPLTYRGMTFTWTNNKELNSVSKDNITYNYRYNKDGIRYRKYLENGTVLYQLDGVLNVGEQKQNNDGTLEYDLEFCYDSNNQILSMIYNGVEYYYVKNILKP